MGKRQDVQARNNLIVNNSPRIAPIAQNELGAEVMAEMNRLRAGFGAGPLEGPVPAFACVMLKAPELMAGHFELGNSLFRGKLTARERELAILRVAWLCQAPYEWGEHVNIAKSVAGMTPEELARIQIGSSAPWNETEAAILRAVEELHDDAMISDATWAVLADSWSEEKLLELPILVGHYMGVAFLQNTARVPLDGANAGLFAI